MKLLPSQKNAIYDRISITGFSPAQFIFDDSRQDRNGETYTLLTLTDTDYYYRFNLIKGRHFSTFSPGEQTLVQDEAPGSWDYQIQYFEAWLGILRRELEQPDKWRQLFESSSSIGIKIDIGDNTQFTYEEVVHIHDAIERAKLATESLPVTPHELTSIHQKLDYLAEKAKTFGKVDWKNLFVGTILTLFVDIALPDEMKRQLWQILKEAFKHVLQIALS